MSANDPSALPGSKRPMLIWPDGQIRPEEPYRCGAFITSLPHLQCVKLSDHDGPHEFPNDYSDF